MERARGLSLNHAAMLPFDQAMIRSIVLDLLQVAGRETLPVPLYHRPCLLWLVVHTRMRPSSKHTLRSSTIDLPCHSWIASMATNPHTEASKFKYTACAAKSQDKANSTQVQRAAIFDLLTGQCDRHGQVSSKRQASSASC
jgi:hypothetical protein